MMPKGKSYGNMPKPKKVGGMSSSKKVMGSMGKSVKSKVLKNHNKMRPTNSIKFPNSKKSSHNSKKKY